MCPPGACCACHSGYPVTAPVLTAKSAAVTAADKQFFGVETEPAEMLATEVEALPLPKAYPRIGLESILCAPTITLGLDEQITISGSRLCRKSLT